jgi:hypothetical protein
MIYFPIESATPGGDSSGSGGHTRDLCQKCALTSDKPIRSAAYRWFEAAGIEALERIVAIPTHAFLVDDISILSATEICRARLSGHNQITDSHLLALAVRRGYRLATFDRDIRQLLLPGQDAGAVFVIEEPHSLPADP